MAPERSSPLPPLNVADLVTVDLESEAETCSSTTSLNVHVVHNVQDEQTKQLAPPAELTSCVETSCCYKKCRRRRGTKSFCHPETRDMKTFINTFIAFLGSGVLGLPYAFRQTGIVTGLVTLGSVAALSTYAMLLVLQCKYKLEQDGKRVTTYGAIGQVALGPLGSFLVNTALVISQTGFCIAYLIFIASNAQKIFNLSQPVVVFMCVPPLVGFSLLKHMRQLAYVSVVADLMCIVGLLVVLQIDLTYMETDDDAIQVVGLTSGIPFFFGIASYCFEGVGLVLPLEQSMQHKRHFTPILVSTVIIITSLYATFGICGYLAFGNETNAIITLNLDASGVAGTLVQLCLCLGLFFTYPVMLYPVFEVVQSIALCKTLHHSPSSRRTDVAVRASIVLCTAIIAATIPDFGRFISFIGSTCCALLAFILPAWFHLCLFRKDAMTWKDRVHQLVVCAMMAVGLAMFCAGVIEAIQCVL
ncbi:hypothetical protein PsorP6_017994 [Peronosclerospora sorghi]|uniref:Uncharacterized protein n=1 Tax=Peronosclerospora sorghi TaxID=230839 RepID=A0ACC0WFC8_9STRA|nr:hypothetical protein PsorP6_017994 [Peronosclerospora sorghi]